MSQSVHRLGLQAFVCLALVAGCVPPDLDLWTESDKGDVSPYRLADARTEGRFFRRNGASPSRIFELPSGAYFFADRGTRCSDGCDLERWLFRTDGTRAGTVGIQQLDGWLHGEPVVSGDHLYFIQSHPTEEQFSLNLVLWRTDGTRMERVEMEGSPRNIFSAEQGLLALCEKEGTSGQRTLSIYLLAIGESGSELLLTEESGQSWARVAVASNGRGILILMDGSLYGSDGTAAGTSRIAVDTAIHTVFATDASFFVVARNPFSDTQELRDVVGELSRGRLRSYDSDPVEEETLRAVAMGSQLVLIGEKGLYFADHTRATLRHFARPLRDQPSIASVNDRVYLLTKQGQLVETDGTIVGTSERDLPIREAGELLAHRDVLGLIGEVNGDRQVFTYSPELSELTVATSFPAGATLVGLHSTSFGLVVAAGRGGDELHRIHDGFAEMLEANPLGNSSSEPVALAEVGDLVFFSVNKDVAWFASGVAHQELWVTDGADARMLREGDYSRTEYRSSIPRPFVRILSDTHACLVETVANPDHSFFDETRTALVCSDGSRAGTMSVDMDDDIAPMELNNDVFVVGFDISGTHALLRVDPRTQTSRPLVSLSAGSRIVAAVKRERDIVFFVKSDDRVDRGIWVSDGTRQGTLRMVASAPFLEGHFSWNLGNERVLGQAGSSIYLATREDYETRVYRTDATASGTVLLGPIGLSQRSIASVSVISRPFGERLVFSDGESIWATGQSSVIRLHRMTGGYFHDMFVLPEGVAVMDDDMLVVTDGTQDGTEALPLRDVETGAVLSDGSLLLASQNAERLYLYKQGELLGAHEPEVATHYEMWPLDEGVLLARRREGRGIELLYYDPRHGLAGSPVELSPESMSSDARRFLMTARTLYFSATDDNGDEELYGVPLSALR